VSRGLPRGLGARDSRERVCCARRVNRSCLPRNAGATICGRRTIRHARHMTVSYPQRLQLRRLARAASRSAEAVIALGAAALVAAAGESGPALMLGLLSGILALASRRALRLATRSRVGAESEAQVRRALERLADDGWRVRHAVDWPGRGDLDHVVRAPSGTGFVIETKTLRWTRDHVVRTFEAARWLARRRRRYPRGVMPVLCVTRARRVERVDGDLLIVSLDRLVPGDGDVRGAAGRRRHRRRSRARAAARAGGHRRRRAARPRRRPGRRPQPPGASTPFIWAPFIHVGAA
jgi:hypothetical protein